MDALTMSPSKEKPKNMPLPSTLSLATLNLHADDIASETTDVAPPLRSSTNFHYPHDPDRLVTAEEMGYRLSEAPGDAPSPESWGYSRHKAPNSSRLELVLGRLLNAPCLTYSSGLSAFHALIVWLQPRVVAIGRGYHGSHGVLKIYQKLTKCTIVNLFDEAAWDEASLGAGDVVHLETPVNPTGRAYDIRHFANLAHKRGAVLTLDATFAPPPLQDPWAFGADYVMHSGTKYLGGHSDLLCGVVAVGKHNRGWPEAYHGMKGERSMMGAVMGSMESWLGLRSMRTFELRIQRQSENCGKLVAFLDACVGGRETGEAAEAVKKIVSKIDHASLQKDDMHWLLKQMPNGFGPVFSIMCRGEEQAKRLPSKLQLFHHATSLGGVESLIEWRKMSDQTIEPELVRVSVGVESWKDLRDDLVNGFRLLMQEGR